MAKYIIYVKRDGFDFYAVEKKASFTFAFSANAIQDLEVIDEEKVLSEISNFIQLNKILPGTSDVILSDAVVFTMDFINDLPVPAVGVPVPNPPTPATPAQAKIDAYLKAIPFEEVTSKTTQIGNGVRVVAVNTDFYTALVSAFKNQQIIISSVVPVSLISGTLQNPPSLTTEIIGVVEKSPELLRQNNFLFMDRIERRQEATHAQPQTGNTTKSRSAILVGVFCFLLIILGVMVYKNFIVSPKPKKLVNAQIPQAPIVAQAVSTPAVSGPAVASPQQIHIDMIGNTTGSTSAFIRNQLNTAGFSNITSEQTVSGQSGILVVFDTSIPPSVSDKVFLPIHTSYPLARSFQSSIGTNQVTITIGN